jgi:acetaldehyde dehydrogenase (acetylating)
MDYDLRSVQEVRDLARLGQIATEQIATFTEEQIDRILKMTGSGDDTGTV